MQQHTLGVVGYIIWVLFTIYSSFQTVKELWKSVRFWPPSVDGPLLGTQCLRLYVYSAPVLERSIAISLSVCLSVSVCPRAYLWNRWTDLHGICCADLLWPWLYPSLAALRYVMYFRFYGWRHVWRNGLYSNAWLAALRYRGGVWCLWLLCWCMCTSHICIIEPFITTPCFIKTTLLIFIIYLPNYGQF